MKTRRVECEKDERKQKDDILCFSGTEKDGVYSLHAHEALEPVWGIGSHIL